MVSQRELGPASLRMYPGDGLVWGPPLLRYTGFGWGRGKPACPRSEQLDMFLVCRPQGTFSV